MINKYLKVSKDFAVEIEILLSEIKAIAGTLDDERAKVLLTEYSNSVAAKLADSQEVEEEIPF